MVQVIKNTLRSDSSGEKAFLTQQAIKKMRQKSEEERAAVLAQKVGLSYVDLNIMPLNTDFIRLVPEAVAIDCQTGIFLRQDRIIHAVLTDAENEKAKEAIQKIADEQGWSVKWYIISQTSLLRLLDRYKHFSLFESLERMQLELSQDDFSALQKRFADILALKKNVLDMSTTETLSLVISGAISLRASDVHFEPQEEGIRMRYRMDGVLQDVGILPFEAYSYIISRVKMMGKMKLNIRKSAQDGRFSFIVKAGETTEKRKVDVRVSILPGRSGETIVMRILEQKSTFLGIGELGLRGHAYDQYQKELQKTNGMIITTGPTGSGKTTLLYSSLNQLNKPGVKIITIEDPVEYEMKNISQTNVSKEDGYTFASGLRSIVRQDPDIILVGEIRDDETADIAIQSSLTGHLVLSTLHTNSASGAIPRLINLGVKPSLIPSSVNAFVAQRLVRRLCEHCKEEYIPAKKTIRIITKIIALISPKANISIPPSVEKLFRSKGCSQCNYTGYKGRIGIFEVLFITDSIVELIERLAPESDISMVAMENGMITMTQDGILKAVEGITSMEEVWRVGGQFEFLEDAYEKLMARYLGQSFFVSQEITQALQKEVLTVDDFQKHTEKLPIEDILAYVVAYALELGAEDIHIEPEERDVQIRLRIDGVLQTIVRLPITQYPVLLGKIKLISGLKTEKQVGLRDSRFTIEREMNDIGETESIDVRVSIILGGYGETAVLRLLNIGAQAKELKLLGMREETQKRLEKATKIPNGIILTTGPTGSGKSTTLYSLLSQMNTPDKKIMTVEDPIEYRVNGILQTQVDEEKGYTFSNALRSLLRQNPDIILVGEIRDEETADMAVRSSMTGHLVFSTLHTNDASSAIQRLVNMGISPKDLITSVNFIMAQRLVRSLCSCKQERETTQEEQLEIKAVFKEYEQVSGNVSTTRDFSKLYEPVGCKKCRGIGYNGMIMLSEAIDMKDAVLHKAIMGGEGGLDIRLVAIKQGMIPMVVDGVEKVLEGITSLEEVRRVTEM